VADLLIVGENSPLRKKTFQPLSSEPTSGNAEVRASAIYVPMQREFAKNQKLQMGTEVVFEFHQKKAAQSKGTMSSPSPPTRIMMVCPNQLKKKRPPS
jgi:hypothetical protein